MWIYYYINKERVTQLALQINPKILIEEIEKDDKSRKLKANTKFTFGKLFELIGLSNETSAETDFTKQKFSEKKYKISEDIIINTVCSYLSEKTSYTYLTKSSTIENIGEIKNLIRFKGVFRPQITGENYNDRLANYENMKSIKWFGSCGKLKISFFTGKESITTPTPIHQVLWEDKDKLPIEGFGIFQSINRKELKFVPLFMGLEFKQNG